MNIGAKETNHLRDWDDDYLEGFSEYLSEQSDSVDDVYDTLICQTCNDGQMHTAWHTGFDRFVQVLLPFDKYRCKSCRAVRWQFNHFSGFTASTFVLYAVSVALVLFFGTTTLGILLDRQYNAPSGSTTDRENFGAANLQAQSAVNNNLTPASADSAGASASRFDEIVDNPLSNTLFEPTGESPDAAGEEESGAGAVLLPASFRITFVPDAAIRAELEGQSLGVSEEPKEIGIGSDGMQEATMDIVLDDTRTEVIVTDVALDQSTIIAVPSTAVSVTENAKLQATDKGKVQLASVKMESETSVESGLLSAVSVEESSGDGNAWLFGQSANAYTAQLGSFNSLAAANNFVARNDIAVSKAHILETVSNDKTWFYVLYGSFEQKGDLGVAVKGLGLNDLLIRKFTGLQSKRCNSWETTDENAFNTNCRQ